MSRSRRKIPRFQRNCVWFKRQASKKVRRSDVDNGGSFRKVYDSYSIADYKGTVLTKQDERDIVARFGDQYMRKGYMK